MAFPTFKTLKEYYTGDLDHSETSSNWGYHLQMWDSYENGAALITSNLSTLQTSIRAAALQGKMTFTISLDVSYQVANLKLKGPHYLSFVAGIYSALQAQAIYDYEVTAALNTCDSSATKIDLLFDFGPKSDKTSVNCVKC
jgi:hypothetical protein